MRIDNSAWGSRDFVDGLCYTLKTSRLSFDDTLEELARKLAERIKELQSYDESLKYLYYALLDRMQATTAAYLTLSALAKAQHDTLKTIIQNMRA